MGAFLFICYLIGLPITLIGVIKYIWRHNHYWSEDEYWQAGMVTVFWPVAVPIGLLYLGGRAFVLWLIDVLEPKRRW